MYILTSEFNKMDFSYEIEIVCCYIEIVSGLYKHTTVQHLNITTITHTCTHALNDFENLYNTYAMF